MLNTEFVCQKHLDYCVAQATQTLAQLPDNSLIPRNIPPDEKKWNLVDYEDWTSGFWPGILWQLYEYTNDVAWKSKAEHYSQLLIPLSGRPAIDHDIGFQVYNSIGHGHRLTKNSAYKEILLKSAHSLADLFNPKVGTILSWPVMVEKMNWPHNTIIDNMINLELLFWAGRNGGSRALHDIAVKHAETTMNNHFREDCTTYHVVVYDPLTGKKIKGVTHQGYADDSLWARGQAWAIYGFTMVYRETDDARFLDFAQKVTDVYLERLPKDRIPYWDFDAPDILKQPRDASAAAATASALLELSAYVPDAEKAAYYRDQAVKMIQVLSTEAFQSRNQNSAFLLHSTGHYPNGSEIDYAIIYADYYYLEALLRLHKLQNKQAKD
ncbi:MAG: glucuronyl hydrolase [Saprospiraceae bacterium]|nr:MAG: glucuronyl hydrolase [Saprospiraceae bacterium]